MLEVGAPAHECGLCFCISRAFRRRLWAELNPVSRSARAPLCTRAASLLDRVHCIGGSVRSGRDSAQVIEPAYLPLPMASRLALDTHLQSRLGAGGANHAYQLRLLDATHAHRLVDLNCHRNLDAHQFVLRSDKHIHVGAFVKQSDGHETLEAVVDFELASFGPWIPYANASHDHQGKGAISAILKAWRTVHRPGTPLLNAHVEEESHAIWLRCHFVRGRPDISSDAMVSSWDKEGVCTTAGCTACAGARKCLI